MTHNLLLTSREALRTGSDRKSSAGGRRRFSAQRLSVRLAIILALLLTALTPAGSPLYAQDAAPIELDEAGFGVAQLDALAPGAQAEFTLELAAGDRVALDLQGESDAVQVAAFRAPFGDLALEGAPEAFNYQAWAPEEGVYTVVVENTGDAAAGFTLRAVVSPAPLPTAKILTLDADGQTLPITVGEAFQVALDAPGAEEFPWQLGDYDTSIVSEAGGSTMVLLGTMPGALRQEIFTFAGMAPGATTLSFTNASAGEDAAASFTVTIEVAEVVEPTPEALTLDDGGVAQASGSLDAQGRASYVLAIEAGASVQALIFPEDAGLVLTVVGADGYPLQTDHAGASSFDQVMPAAQEYTFKVINSGNAAQEYEFAVSVTPGAAPAGEAELTGDAALGLDLVMQYFDALQANDAEQVAALLSPAFQIVRATGERFDATNYLDNLPRFEAYAVSELYATRTGGLLVVAYRVATDTTLDGGAVDLGAAAPRLTVFQEIDGAWKVAAHANFAAPAEAPLATAPAPAEDAAPTAELALSEADNGATFQVAAGGKVAITLPGNPTTGYIWQVTANDESILAPLGNAFTPDSDAAGAGGLEQFDFQAVAPGTVTLELANSRPWESDVAPEQTFTAVIEVVAAAAAESASITVGMDNNGGAVTLLPGDVLLLALDGAADGAWQLVQGDARIVQPLGDWEQTPTDGDATQARFQRAFLGVGPGEAELQFEFMQADGAVAAEGYALTVDVPPLEPGSRGAVNLTEADAGGESALVVGDTLVVRLPANPTTGYDWRVVSTNDALLPAAGEPLYAAESDLTGAGGVYTFRFLAQAAGEAAVQIGEFAPGADDPDQTLDFNATLVEPAPLTGNTVTVTADDAGKRIDVTAGDWLAIELESNPTTGYLWLLTANDGAVLRLLPESGFVQDPGAEGVTGAGGVQHFLLRALAPGEVELSIGLFPPGEELPEQIYDLTVTVK